MRKEVPFFLIESFSAKEMRISFSFDNFAVGGDRYTRGRKSINQIWRTIRTSSHFLEIDRGAPSLPPLSKLSLGSQNYFEPATLHHLLVPRGKYTRNSLRLVNMALRVMKNSACPLEVQDIFNVLKKSVGPLPN